MSESSKNPPRWKGDGVEPVAGDEAERAAARAEGRAPVRASELSDALESQPVDDVVRAPSGETPDEKTEDAAEAHRERAASQDRPARGRL